VKWGFFMDVFKGIFAVYRGCPSYKKAACGYLTKPVEDWINMP
jgi:hypothetical protein